MGWRVLAASVRGRRHEKTGQPCQDAHRWRVLPGNVLAAAVADGAGSAALAEVGAELAAQTAVERVCQLGSERILKADADGLRDMLLEVFKTTRAALLAEAEQRKTHERTLATTLILVLATPGFAAAAQVGDGAVVVEESAGNYAALTNPAWSEYLNETTFLTSADALERIQVAVRSGSPIHLAAISDGLQMLAMRLPAGAPHSPFFAPLWRLADTETTSGNEELVAFLHSARIGERTDDDLTLLLAANV